MLSHQRTVEDGGGWPSSVRREWSHLTSAAALARALYSASVLERATVACFLQLQEIRFLPKKISNCLWSDDHYGNLPNQHQKMLELKKRSWDKSVDQSEWCSSNNAGGIWWTASEEVGAFAWIEIICLLWRLCQAVWELSIEEHPLCFCRECGQGMALPQRQRDL